MAVTTIFILAPLALIAAIIYSYLFFSKYKLYSGIENNIIKIVLRIVTYTIIIVLLTVILSVFGMMLMVGLIGLLLLLVLDIVGIVLLIMKLIRYLEKK